MIDEDVIRSESCARAFGHMFWAFIFFFDLRLTVDNLSIDILPDFIGWTMMATALTWILDLSPRVRGLRGLAILLAILALFDFIQLRAPAHRSPGVPIYISPVSPVLFLLFILDIVFFWKLCGLIMDMATIVESRIIRERAEFRRRLYVGYAVLLVSGTLTAFLVRSSTIFLILVTVPLAIVLFVLMMGLMAGTKRMCRQAMLA